MGETLTNDEINARIATDNAARTEEARRIAVAHLASQNVPGYSVSPDVPPAMSSASTPPPVSIGLGPAQLEPPPKPSVMSRLGSGIKDAAIVGAGGLLGGPAGASVAANYVTSKNLPAAPAKPEAPPPELDPAGPPALPGGADDGPLLIDRRGGGAGRIIPAGMYPHSATTQAHLGRAVPGESRHAFGASTALELEGADAQRTADRDYNVQIQNLQADRLQANEDAATRHARIQAERDGIVKQRLSQIEATNAEASAAIDPSQYWQDRGSLAKVLGAITVGLGEYSSKINGGPNTALQIIEGGINREIQAQLANRQLAGQKAGRQERLLDLHLARLGDQDKAADATKLGLYDNTLIQMDAFKAQHGAATSEANFLNLQAGILEKRGELVNKMGLQETDDVNKQYTEQWHQAQMLGGSGAPAGKMEGLELIPVPASDQTSEKGKMIAVPKGSHQELGKTVGATNAIIGINQDALARIQDIKKDWELAKGGDSTAIARIQANRKTLEDLGQRKASLTSAAEAQGVLKEAEFQRAMDDRVMFNDWWKPGVNVEKRIQAQNNGLAGAAGRMVAGHGGQEVKMAYTRDKNGALQPTPLFTGRMYVPPPVGPEMGPVKAPKGK